MVKVVIVCGSSYCTVTALLLFFIFHVQHVMLTAEAVVEKTIVVTGDASRGGRLNEMTVQLASSLQSLYT